MVYTSGSLYRLTVNTVGNVLKMTEENLEIGRFPCDFEPHWPEPCAAKSAGQNSNLIQSLRGLCGGTQAVPPPCCADLIACRECTSFVVGVLIAALPGMTAFPSALQQLLLHFGFHFRNCRSICRAVFKALQFRLDGHGGDGAWSS